MEYCKRILISKMIVFRQTEVGNGKQKKKIAQEHEMKATCRHIADEIKSHKK